MIRKRGFPPVADARARVLILGTLPGAQSLRLQQYYGLPANAFWRIMGAVFGAGPELDYAARCERLRASSVALWDVCEAARREGSLDSALRDVDANDFSAFFAAHPQIRKICFNGQTAARLFETRVAPGLDDAWRALPRIALPSTSPAHTLAFDSKLALWRAALDGR